MKKTRFSLVVLMCALLAALLVAVGCSPKKVEYSVTFMNGTETVATLKVEEGKKIEASAIPEAPVKEGYAFDGWYADTTKIEAGYEPTADITAEAKFTDLFTLVFKNGTETVKTVNVRPGETLAAADMPADITKEKFDFDGWYIGATKIEAGYKPTADATVEAKFTGLFALIFKNGTETIKTVNVRTGEKLNAADIPADIAKEKFDFDGWYAGTTKIEAGYEPTADVTIEAKFTEIFTITFKNGAETIKTVNVRADETLAAADVPADVTKEKFDFDGWFVDTAKVEAGYKPTADVTAEAKFTELFTVIFKNGEETVKTATARQGEPLADDDIPGDIDLPGYTFVGWFDGTNKFDEKNGVEADATYLAKFEKSSYFVKFVNGAQEQIVYVSMSPDAKLAAEDIPGAPAGDGVFLGWYKDGVKLEGETSVTADVTYTALFVNQASYAGVWSDSGKYMNVIFSEDGFVTIANTVKQKAYTYDAAKGTVTYKEGVGLGGKTWEFLAVGDTMQLTYGRYDEYEDYLTDTYTLEKCGSVDYAGTYRNGTAYLKIANGGVVTEYSDVKYYARMYKEGDSYIIEYKKSENTALERVTAVIDEKGNIVVAEAPERSGKGIFVKDFTAYASYFGDADGYQYLYEYTVNNEKIFVYCDNNANYAYASVEGGIAEGNIVTVTVGQNAYVIKFVSGSEFTFAGAERGTYKGAAGDLTLDGFGTAKLGAGAETEYHMAGSIAVLGEKGYTIDTAAKTYTEAQRNEYVGIYKRPDSASYTLTLDGFGGASLLYYSYTYAGTYAVANGKITFTGLYSTIDGEWTVAENGNVFINAKDTSIAFIKEGYTVASHIGDFEGWWVDSAGNYISVDVESETVQYGGVPIGFTSNWNGTELYFRAEDPLVSLSYKVCDFTATVSGDALTLVHERTTGYDDIYEEYITETITETYTATTEPVVELDAFAGGWKGNGNVFWFDGINKGTFNPGGGVQSFTYAKDAAAERITFSVNGMDFVVTIKSPGVLSVAWDDGEYTGTYDAVAEAADAFAGSWKDSDPTHYYQYVLTFNGYGTVNVTTKNFNKDVTYTIKDNTVTFTANWEDWTCTLNADGTLTVKSVDSDNYESVNATYIKQAAEQAPDAFAGTWAVDSITVVFDGKGKVTYDGAEYSYTVSGETATFTTSGGMELTCTLTSATEMNVHFYDGGDNNFHKTLIKQ